MKRVAVILGIIMLAGASFAGTVTQTASNTIETVQAPRGGADDHNFYDIIWDAVVAMSGTDLPAVITELNARLVTNVTETVTISPSALSTNAAAITITAAAGNDITALFALSDENATYVTANAAIQTNEYKLAISLNGTNIYVGATSTP